MMLYVRIREPYVIYIYTDEQTPGGEKQQERIRIIITVPNTKKQKGLWKPKEIQNKLEREQLSSVARRIDTLADSLMRYPKKLQGCSLRCMTEMGVRVSVGKYRTHGQVVARLCKSVRANNIDQNVNR